MNHFRDFTEQTSLNVTDLFLIEEAANPYITKKVQGSTIVTAIAATLTSYFSPVAMVSAFAGITAPTGWLLCDGSSLLRATYSSLSAALILSKGAVTITIATPGVVSLSTHGLITGDRVHLTTTGALPTGLSASTDYWVIYNDANSFWLATSLANAIAGTKIATSGSQSGTHTLYRSPYGIADATHFNVPDATEASIVALGSRSTGVTAHDVYALGQFKDDQFQGHYTDVNMPSATSGGTLYGLGVGAFYQNANTPLSRTTGSTPGYSPVSDGTNGTPRTGTSTHGKQIGMNFIIKT